MHQIITSVFSISNIYTYDITTFEKSNETLHKLDVKINCLKVRITQESRIRSPQKLDSTCKLKCIFMITLSLKKIHPLSLEKKKIKFSQIEDNSKVLMCRLQTLEKNMIIYIISNFPPSLKGIPSLIQFPWIENNSRTTQPILKKKKNCIRTTSHITLLQHCQVLGKSVQRFRRSTAHKFQFIHKWIDKYITLCNKFQLFEIYKNGNSQF